MTKTIELAAKIEVLKSLMAQIDAAKAAEDAVAALPEDDEAELDRIDAVRRAANNAITGMAEGLVWHAIVLVLDGGDLICEDEGGRFTKQFDGCYQWAELHAARMPALAMDVADIGTDERKLRRYLTSLIIGCRPHNVVYPA